MSFLLQIKSGIPEQKRIYNDNDLFSPEDKALGFVQTQIFLSLNTMATQYKQDIRT